MPVEFFCNACGLVFAVGPYAVRSWYPARELLVCRSCGTCHEVQHPLNEKKRKPRLLSEGEPTVLEAKPEGPAFAGSLRTVQQELPASFRAADIEKLACAHCKEVGTLVGSWERSGCPKCHQEGLVETGGWIT